jgi:hypothetical protein
MLRVPSPTPQKKKKKSDHYIQTTIIAKQDQIIKSEHNKKYRRTM